MRVVLVCPVRGCGRALGREGPCWVCPDGHSFDQRRSGALNLLQPQDRRSPRPGDSREAAEARRRLALSGLDRGLHEALAGMMTAWSGRAVPTLLDVGCGEGSFLRSLEDRSGLERHGTDLSAIAIELAARATPGALFVVANADRFLPYADQSFAVVTSIDARVNASEFARVSRKGGLLLVAVPGTDDLVELRERVQGGRREKARAPRILDTLKESFIPKESRTVRERRVLQASELKDLLIATYRGFRRSEQRSVEALTSMTVTISHDILVFERG